MTTILKCTCNHKDQDKLYGKGKRLHNVSGDGTKAFCTVCCPSNVRDKRVPGRPARTFKVIRSNV